MCLIIFEQNLQILIIVVLYTVVGAPTSALCLRVEQSHLLVRLILMHYSIPYSWLQYTK